MEQTRTSGKTAPFLLLALAAALLAACTDNKDSISSASDYYGNVRFSASVEQQTKTMILYNNGYPNSGQVFWTPQDCIAVTNGSTKPVQFTACCTDTVSESDFEGEIEASDNYYALYPYGTDVAFSQGAFRFSLPAHQAFRHNSFGSGVFPMVAQSNGKMLHFQHLCGIFHLHLTGNNDVISQVQFSAHDSLGQPMKVSGQASVAMDYDAGPSLQMGSGADTVVTIDCNEEVVLSDIPTTFHIVLPPAVYHSFTVSVGTSDGKTMYIKGTNPLSIVRGRGAIASALGFNTVIDTVVVIPDVNFRKYLVDNYDTNSSGKIERSEARAVTSLDVHGLGIESLEGMEYFTNLQSLNCFNNLLTELDLSSLTKLRALGCGVNNLTALDLSMLRSLTFINCRDNALTSLNVDSLSDLTHLYCYHNSISDLSMAGLTSLRIFCCQGNQLQNVELSWSKGLQVLECDSNSIATLNVGNLTQLYYLSCRHNKIQTLDIENLTALSTLDCSDNVIDVLNIAKLKDLEWLSCYSNNLSSLDFHSSPKLEFLSCADNRLTELTAGSNTLLRDIFCQDNNLDTLSLSGCTDIDTLVCHANSLSGISLYKAPNSCFLHDYGDWVTLRTDTAGIYGYFKPAVWIADSISNACYKPQNVAGVNGDGSRFPPFPAIPTFELKFMGMRTVPIYLTIFPFYFQQI